MTTTKLPRLQQGFPLVDENGTPHPAFHIWWDKMAKTLEGALGNLSTQLAAIQAAQTSANNAQSQAQEYMEDIPDATIQADYTGTVSPSSQLPLYISPKRWNNTTSVTTSSTWSATVIGPVTASINSSTGQITVTAISGNGTITVTSVRTVGGTAVTLTKTFTLYYNIAPAPITGSSGGSSSGSGGTTTTVTSFNTFGSTGMTDVTGTMTVTVGSAGQVALSAPLNVKTSNTSPAATYPVFGRWQWDSTGAGAWTDLGASDVQSSPDNYVDGPDPETGAYRQHNGALTVSATKTGLTVGSSQKFRFRCRNGSGGRVMSLTGTASAVGS